jgi:hypothetical protein
LRDLRKVEGFLKEFSGELVSAEGPLKCGTQNEQTDELSVIERHDTALVNQ